MDTQLMVYHNFQSKDQISLVHKLLMEMISYTIILIKYQLVSVILVVVMLFGIKNFQSKLLKSIIQSLRVQV